MTGALGLLTRFGLTKPAGESSGAGLILNDPLPSGLPIITNAAQLGWRFTVNATPITAVGLRLNMSTGGNEETAYLWRASDKALLAQVAITPTADEWTAGAFGAPIALAANTSYVIAVRRTSGASRPVRLPNASSLTLSPLITFERGVYNAGTSFPADEASLTVRGLVDLLLA